MSEFAVIVAVNEFYSHIMQPYLPIIFPLPINELQPMFTATHPSNHCRFIQHKAEASVAASLRIEDADASRPNLGWYPLVMTDIAIEHDHL